MVKIVCRECNKECRDDTQLHRHLKAHHMSQGNYYSKHYPRYDKLDGTPIVFRNREWYFTTDFNSRANLKDWLDQVDKEEAKDYVRSLLLARKDRKNLIYSPAQVELRSLPMPGMHYMNRLFGDYYAECARLGFKNRFDRVGFSGAWKKLSDSHRIIVDTREQTSLSFPNIKTIVEGLPFGDYKLNDDVFSHNVVIERKAIGDFYNTMSGAYERFEREIERAEAAGFYLIVVVEGAFEKVYEYSAFLKRRSIIISPEFVFHNMRQLCQKYSMIQFLFVDDREEASQAIIKLLQSDGQCKSIDIQYAYDTGRLL